MKNTPALAKKAALTVAAGALALSMGALAGCASSNNADAQRIAQLEREIEELKSQGSGESSSSGSSSNTPGSNDSAANDAAANGGSSSSSDGSANSSNTGTSGIQITDATAQDFSARADALIAEADAAQVGADRTATIATYLDFDQRFEALENEIDLYDDQREIEYKSGSLDWKGYRAIEAQLDYIENRLDHAKDSLELRFGIDD
ncbi:hypothetical protein [Rubneribacter sp.]|nr:hypothetical protein [Candidatus Rubneribacter avistercoris]